MSLTRKHYEAMAKRMAWCREVIEGNSDEEFVAAALLTHEYMVDNIAKVYANDNLRFDRARFRKECGIPK